MAVLRLIKPLVFRILCLFGVHHVFRWWNRNKLLVLMYHGFVEDDSTSPPSWLLAPCSAFEQQLRYLSRRYDVVPVSVACESLVRTRRFSRPTCCLTFDDGYRNNFTLAFPLLQKYETPAAIYLATGLIGTQKVHWTVKLERAFFQTTTETLDLRECDLPEYPLGAERMQSCINLTAAVYRCHGADQDRVLEATFQQLGLTVDEDFSDFEPLSWGEVKQMKESGLVEFGGHTISHTIVSPLSDFEQKTEIVESMKTVEAHVGWPVSTFAYPNGTPDDFDERAKAVLAELGALAAFSTIRGLNDHKTDRYQLQRIHVSNETTMPEFKLRTSGALTALRSLVGLPD